MSTTTSTNDATFPRLVREARKRRRLSLPELAKLSGVPYGTVREVEAGEHAPRIYAAAKIAKVLGIRVGLASLADDDVT